MRKAMKLISIIIGAGLIVLAFICCDSSGGANGGAGFVISIDSLENNATTAFRTQYVVCGDVLDPDPSSPMIFDGTISVWVNDISTIADADYDSVTEKFTMDHPITLRSGANTIYAAIYTSGGSEYKRSNTLSITGSFSNPLYRAQLTWDTAGNDVDLHLVHNGTWDSSHHCYWLNDTIPGMAQLDYDDVDGYGPENMSIELGAPAGSYAILVKYYSTDGVTSDVNATVKIFDKNDALISTHTQVFTPADESLNSDIAEPGKDWNVKTLTVP